MKSDIDKAVEAEREACLKELELVYLETPNDRENLEEAIEAIRERGINDECERLSAALKEAGKLK